MGKRPNNNSNVRWVHVAQACRLSRHGGVSVKQLLNFTPINESITRPRLQHLSSNQTNRRTFPPVAHIIRLVFKADVADRFTRRNCAINDFCTDKCFTSAPPERMQVDVPRTELCSTAIELANSSPIHKDSTALTVRHKADDARRFTRASGYDNNVLNTADLSATRIKERKPRHSEGINHVARHGAKVTRVRAL